MDSFLQHIANCILLLTANALGLTSYFVDEKQQRRAFLETRQSLEVKLVIEEQSAEQVSNQTTSINLSRQAGKKSVHNNMEFVQSTCIRRGQVLLSLPFTYFFSPLEHLTFLRHCIIDISYEINTYFIHYQLKEDHVNPLGYIKYCRL